MRERNTQPKRRSDTLMVIGKDKLTFTKRVTEKGGRGQREKR